MGARGVVEPCVTPLPAFLLAQGRGDGAGGRAQTKRYMTTSYSDTELVAARLHEAEDRNQARPRFPIVHRVLPS